VTGCAGKDVCHVSIFPRTESSPPQVSYTNNKELRVVAGGNSIVHNNEGSAGCRGSQAEGSNVCCNEYDTGSRGLEVCNDVVAADYMLGMQNELSVPVSSIAKGNEGHKVGELFRNDGENIYVNVNVHATRNTAINCFRTIKCWCDRLSCYHARVIISPSLSTII
jgi:hypothetical protein